MEFESIQSRNLARFTEQLQYVDELAAVVLKGHLVLEEQLDRIIRRFLFHPKHLDGASLRFHQKIKIAQSMSLDGHENSIWNLLLALNALRNNLAHSLEHDKRQSKLNHVLTLFASESDDTDSRTTDDAPLRDHEIVSLAMAMVLGFLGSFEAEVARFRDLIDVLDKTVNPHRHSNDTKPQEANHQSSTNSQENRGEPRQA